MAMAQEGQASDAGKSAGGGGAASLSAVHRVALVLIWLAGMIVGGGLLLVLYAAVVWLRLPDVAKLAEGDPGPTAFMLIDACDEPARTYRPLGEIDPRVGCAMVWAEDWRFFRHDGVDSRALKGAMQTNWRAGSWRLGGSTIPMQLARNLFLSRARTPSRKLSEIVLARRLVSHHTRERLLELYLNSVELAPCVYGVEAGARHYFGHGADTLDPAEATFLAAMLPRPSRRPGAYDADRAALVRRQQELLTLLARARLIRRADLRAARQVVLAGWRDGWAGHQPSVAGPAPPSWYERACGTLGWAGQRQKAAEF